MLVGCCRQLIKVTPEEELILLGQTVGSQQELMLYLYEEHVLMCQDECSCGAVMDKDALIDPLGVGYLQKLGYNPQNPPFCQIGGVAF